MFMTFTTNNGLPGNFIRALARDRQDRLWVGTPQGLAVFESTNLIPFSAGQITNAVAGAPAGRLMGNARLMPAQRPTGDTQQPMKVENVLQLDGNGSYVELPPNIFDGLEEATVEGWVKWETFGPADSMFFCFGVEGQAMFLGNQESSPGVKFVIYDANHQRHGWRGPAQNFPDSALAAELLETNRWCHLAAVSGKDGMKLYYNGELVGRLGYTSSFAAIRQPITNYLGKAVGAMTPISEAR